MNGRVVVESVDVLWKEQNIVSRMDSEKHWIFIREPVAESVLSVVGVEKEGGRKGRRG